MSSRLNLLLDQLIDLRDNLDKAPETGICPAMYYRMNQVKGTLEVLGSITREWPERNQSASYPVDGHEGYHKDYTNKTLWKNPKRLALLDFIIKEIQDDPKRVILRAKVYLPHFEYLEWSGQL